MSVNGPVERKSKTCRCGAYLPLCGDRFPKHNLGDTPDWMGDSICVLSGQLARRRVLPESQTWWHKYLPKQ